VDVLPEIFAWQVLQLFRAKLVEVNAVHVLIGLLTSATNYAIVRAHKIDNRDIAHLCSSHLRRGYFFLSSSVARLIAI